MISTGTSLESFAAAALAALGEQSSPASETFRVVEMRIERGGVVGQPQYIVDVERIDAG
jgi:flavin-binding protein dodecin